MEALRLIQKIPDSGNLTLTLPQHRGKTVEIIVLSASNDRKNEPYTYMKLQEQSGFVINALSSPTEDIWNDI